MPPASHLFIYWRVNPERAADAESAARQLQTTLRQRWPGIKTALFRRDDAESNRVTLMETYSELGDNEAQLLSLAGEALAPWATNGRYIERFTRLAP